MTTLAGKCTRPPKGLNMIKIKYDYGREIWSFINNIYKIIYEGIIIWYCVKPHINIWYNNKDY